MAKPVTQETTMPKKPAAAKEPAVKRVAKAVPKPTAPKAAAAKPAAAASVSETVSAPQQAAPAPQYATDTGFDASSDAPWAQKDIWMRGLHMLILMVLFWFGVALGFLTSVLQFGWLLFAGKRNDDIAEFGEVIATWLGKTARFLTAASEKKPFPFEKL